MPPSRTYRRAAVHGPSDQRLPRARKRFGQHFLEPAWVRKIIDAMAPTSDQVFIEIGPGRGALTRPLAERAGTVVAVEIDRDLARRLSDARLPNVTVMQGDVLDVTVDALRAEVAAACGGTPWRVAGNLPYNVASPILLHLGRLWTAGAPFADATLMLQREVADRLTAAPGTRDYSPLTLAVNRVADTERLLVLPPGAFRPPPRVHSAVVRLRFRQPTPAARDEALFQQLVQAVFSQRRKTVANGLSAFASARGLSAASVLERAGIDGGRRPDTLSPAELVALADALASESGRAVL